MTIIDCHACPVRGRHCPECFVPVVAAQWLLPAETAEPEATRHPPPSAGAPLPLTEREWEAVDVFVDAGLVSAWDVLELSATAEAPDEPGYRQVG